MSMLLFTPEELALLADRRFFPAKARITAKLRHHLEAIQAGLTPEVRDDGWIVPRHFDPARFQFVKGEHLEEFPYQYLDFPKHFAGDDMLTFRSLCWWGHHVVFAMILGGEHLLRYKRNLINRYHQVADRELHISLAPTPWEWKAGEGYTLPVTHDRKPEVSAVLAGRQFLKLARYLPLDGPVVSEGRLPAVARETFLALRPILAA